MQKDLKAFLKTKRKVTDYRPVCERIKDYSDVSTVPQKEHSIVQASRCMDCGTPFCHWGCPIGNYIPEWNEALYKGQLLKACELLEAANNLPEITGRICPALCEYSCVLGINDDPVTIRENEKSIVEYAFKDGLISAKPPKRRTGKSVAVVGSGPAGLSCAAQLNKAGNSVAVFERDVNFGGILRYGIPDFKLEKWVIERRLDIWRKQGIEFRASVNVGRDYSAEKLLRDFDAVVLACGSRVPRDLNLEGRQLSGIHFASDYLIQSNKRVAGEIIPQNELIDAKGKRVVVIGAGDTGSDCIGTAHRQGASCVVQIEIMPQPCECRTADMPWPKYPLLLKTSTSHEEGGERHWSVSTKKFIGAAGKIKKILCVKAGLAKETSGCPLIKDIPGTEFEIEADLVILALGFLYPEKSVLVSELKLELDSRGNIKTGLSGAGSAFLTSQKGVFSCGDMRRGQSLIVWAISEGRRCAHHVDKFLNGSSFLPIM